ncbi:hypothetical protein GFL91_36280, partial [Rhizobium leguminosarum bv. viciae]|nr:hypothetical protein [Rhizobium leguminosarum bv. viciae]
PPLTAPTVPTAPTAPALAAPAPPKPPELGVESPPVPPMPPLVPAPPPPPPAPPKLLSVPSPPGPPAVPLLLAPAVPPGPPAFPPAPASAHTAVAVRAPTSVIDETVISSLVVSDFTRAIDVVVPAEWSGTTFPACAGDLGIRPTSGRNVRDVAIARTPHAVTSAAFRLAQLIYLSMAPDSLSGKVEPRLWKCDCQTRTN